MMYLRILVAILFGSLIGCGPDSLKKVSNEASVSQWRALHVAGYNSSSRLNRLKTELPELARMGVNTLILEVNYGFSWQSHPELRYGSDPITRDDAASFALACEQHGIRLIPLFQCFSRQSVGPTTMPLLAKYPELDTLPNLYPDNEGLFAREWDPFNEKVNQIVFALLDELIEAFGAKAIHVGMDRVLLLGHKESPGTFGNDNAMVFARVANEFHHHLTVEKGLQMLIWSDRLVDSRVFPYGPMESSAIDTAEAITMMQNDIILCTWTNQARETYEVVPYFLEKGFRVLTAAGPDPKASRAMVKYTGKQQHPNLLGHVFLSWEYRENLPSWSPLVKGMAKLKP